MTQVVTVVIPTYNRARDLAVALDSVRKQTYSEWEAIVVDNHSSDNTREVVGRFNDARIKFVEITNNGLIAASRNLGIRHASGKFVAFLDSDDFWTAEKLEKSVNWLNQGFDVVYHDMHIVSTARIYLGARKLITRQLASPVFDDLLINGNALPTSSVVLRKDVLDNVGGFREDVEIIAGEDFDLWLQLACVTQRFKRIEGVLGYLTRSNSNEFSSSRLISILSETEKRYLCRLSAEDRERAHANWIDYALVRAQFCEKQYSAAHRHLMKVLTTSGRLSFRIKAAAMLISIAARRAIGSQS